MATNCIKKLVIDTDPGLDDTQAIMMALAHQDVEILALTTVAGNVGIEKVTQNALKVLTVCGRLDIPIYRGASHSILGKVCEASPYHGNDGFGDVADDIVVDTSLVEKEHAAMALINLVNKYPGEITLVTLAPLTNIALAIRLDPTFGSKLKDCYMMGGNIEGRGNVTTSAEFNFHADPEAAYIVLKELRCPITIATWELCLRHSLPWEWYDIFTEQDHCKARFIKSHETNVVKDLKDQNLEYVLCDQFAMAFLLDEAVIEESFSRHATVEMKGEHTRGQVVIDHGGKKQQEQNVRFVTKANMDMDAYHKLRSCDTSNAKFLHLREKRMVKKCAENEWPTYIPCDEVAMAILLNDKVAVKKERHFATVELTGSYTRGQVVLDREGMLNQEKNVTFVTEVDDKLYYEMLCLALSDCKNFK